MPRAILILCSAALLAAAALSVDAATGATPPRSPALPDFEGFIRVQDGRFVDANCQEFPVTGMNTWMLMEAAAGLAVIPCDLPAGMNAVEYTFATAAANGMTVVRAFAHGVNNTLPLQTEPGVYNETAFKALDYILDVAASYGVKVIFTMGDNWQFADAKRNYNTWAGFDEGSDMFWTSEETKGWYKAHMQKMVDRVNTVNGLRYGEDPTIFAWNLMNEPRCDCFPLQLPYPPVFTALPPGCAPTCADTITGWVEEMGDHLKSLDPNHLVTVGEEGFWGFYDSHRPSNPEDSVSPWAGLTGNNFTAQHSFDSIDFTGVHYWPDQWTPKATSDGPFFSSWMQLHKELAASLGKPLILEELGKGVIFNQTRDDLAASVASRRQPFMEMVYGQFNQSLQTGGVWRGTLFWMWGFCPENTQENNLQVAAGDADFGAVIAPSALSAALRAAAESPISECIKVEVANETAMAPAAVQQRPIPPQPPAVPMTQQPMTHPPMSQQPMTQPPMSQPETPSRSQATSPPTSQGTTGIASLQTAG